MELHPEYIGQTLLKLGFESWFRYLFRIIEGRSFIVEPIHPDLFDTFQEIYELKKLRQTINLPPRSSKTTLCKYFIVYTWCIEPKANFIYTSYSQGLLNDIARDIQNIMEHPAFKAMFPVKAMVEDEKLDPIDEFWRQYWQDTKENKNIYSSKKIVTYAGGVCIFASAGSQILGFGCGIRGAEDFSGCLILDDFDKPQDITSEVIRSKSKRYFSETLLSRLNDFNVPILNVQQRLHVDDISGYLKQNYGFEVLKKPLLDIHGVCQIPSQYDERRLKELQFDKSAFSALYQQEPTIEEGNLIKRDWWQYYKPEETPVEGVLIITADTAYKKSKTADFSCLQCWELKTGKLLMRDMIVDKWEFPELLENAKMFWDKWTQPEMIIRAKYFFIEDKASGISLVQTLEDLGINTVAWKPKDFDFPDDKVGRTKEASWAIFSGLVFLPENNKMSEYLVDEAAAFKEDMSHFHDDACFVAGTKIATLWGYKNIEQIKSGDLIITPLGLKKCFLAGMTGRKETINSVGLKATANHKVFDKGVFVELKNIKNDKGLDFLNFRSLIKWKYRKLLYSMESNINLWGRKGIICLNQIQIKEGKIRKDFTWRFGNFIQEKKFLKAMLFTIKTITALIMIFLILSVFHVSNIGKCIKKIFTNGRKAMNLKNIYLKSEKRHQLGINPMLGKIGIKKWLTIIIQSFIKKKHVKDVGAFLRRQKTQIYVKSVKIQYTMLKDGKQILNTTGKKIEKEDKEKKEIVYNLTVSGAGCYYANNVLVSNCDAANMSFSIWRYYGGMRDTGQ